MVRQLQTSEFDQWDAFVQEHPAGTIFHTTTWLKDSGTLQVLIVEDGNGIVGGIALVKRKRFGVTGYHVSPYTPYGGPLVRPSRKQGRSSIASEEQKRVSNLLAAIPNLGHVDIQMPPGSEFDMIPFFNAGYSVGVGYTHVLNPIQDEFLHHMSKTNRTYMRRLHDMKVAEELIVDEDHDFDSAKDLLRDVMELKRFSGDLSLLQQRLSALSPEQWGLIHVSPSDGERLATLLYLRDWRRMYYIASGTRRVSGILNQASLLGFERLRQIASENDLVLDLEGSILPGVERYYRQLGGIKVPVYRAERTRSPYYALLRCAKRWLNSR